MENPDSNVIYNKYQTFNKCNRVGSIPSLMHSLACVLVCFLDESHTEWDETEPQSS